MYLFTAVIILGGLIGLFIWWAVARKLPAEAPPDRDGDPVLPKYKQDALDRQAGRKDRVL